MPPQAAAHTQIKVGQLAACTKASALSTSTPAPQGKQAPCGQVVGQPAGGVLEDEAAHTECARDGRGGGQVHANLRAIGGGDGAQAYLEDAADHGCPGQRGAKAPGTQQAHRLVVIVHGLEVGDRGRQRDQQAEGQATRGDGVGFDGADAQQTGQHRPQRHARTQQGLVQAGEAASVAGRHVVGDQGFCGVPGGGGPHAGYQAQAAPSAVVIGEQVAQAGDELQQQAGAVGMAHAHAGKQLRHEGHQRGHADEGQHGEQADGGAAGASRLQAHGQHGVEQAVAQHHQGGAQHHAQQAWGQLGGRGGQDSHPRL